MNRRLLSVAATAILAAAAIVICRNTPTKAQPLIKPNGSLARPPAASPLPVAQVILFNSGVAYFQREGEVEESTRVDLAFPADQVNDLLKSLVLQDLDGGQVSTISYDSQDPIDKTLKTFAIDLTSNPSLGQILNQARGEKVEVTMQPSNNSQPETLTGTIVGMESRPSEPLAGLGTLSGLGTPTAPAGGDMLNLLCTEGMRSLPLSQVHRVRFLNPALQEEFNRALAILASAHDTQKKTVSLDFRGQGRRTVRVGYVVENPIWKTSYRLVLDKMGKPFLQGWAVVENTSADDWTNVRMVLVSGRPISFQMNLYQPLYVPRPTVEPELFASLRPPAYSGPIGEEGQPAPAGAGAPGGLGVLGGGALGGFGAPQKSPYQTPSMGQADPVSGTKLSYEELQKRRQEHKEGKGEAKDEAKAIGGRLAAMDIKEGVASAASAGQLGDYCQYEIEQKVSLPRQKSAMLPIISQAVEATRVSIYNESVQARFPLLGLRFKNTSAQSLMQGPITVYEEGSYAGDAQVMDLQPNEERLLGYAIDLGTEVKTEAREAPSQLISVKIVKGVSHASSKLRQTKTYLVKNRSDHDRLLLIEHPVHPGWDLVAPAKAAEKSRDSYRFSLPVAAGQSARQEVVEEQTTQEEIALASDIDRAVQRYFSTEISSPRVKEALKKALDLKGKVSEAQGERARVEGQLKAITEDQARIRANLEKVPPTSAAYKRYLEKMDTQETEIEKLQAQIKQLQETEKQKKMEYEDFLAGLSVE